MSEAKERLIRAGEQLFAREGIDGARIKDLNELAGQRNVSALHYHFGSRAGLLAAIVDRHSSVVDGDRAERLGTVGDDATLHELMVVIIEPLGDELASTSGRDYLRIVPQLFDGDTSPRALISAIDRARALMGDTPEGLRRERLGAMLLAITTLLAARASAVERGATLALPHGAFVANLVDMAEAMLLAPVSVAASGGSATRTARQRSRPGLAASIAGG